jgi:hypothetical protein
MQRPPAPPAAAPERGIAAVSLYGKRCGCGRLNERWAPACVACGHSLDAVPAEYVPRGPSSIRPGTDENGGARTLGTVGVVCGLLGLLVLPYLLALVAIGCGIASAMKGHKRGIASIVLGVLAAAASMVVDAVYSATP